MDTPKDRIERWFIAPLRFLKEHGYNHEGFLVLMTAIALAERIICSKRKQDKLVGKIQSFEACGSEFLGIEQSVFTEFWEMYRNGMMHHAQPFSGQYKKSRGDETFWDWDISASYTGLPVIAENKANGKKIIQIDPWKWLELVAETYSRHPELIELNDSRKLGNARNEPRNEPQALQENHPDHPRHIQIGEIKTGSYL